MCGCICIRFVLQQVCRELQIIISLPSACQRNVCIAFRPTLIINVTIINITIGCNYFIPKPYLSALSTSQDPDIFYISATKTDEVELTLRVPIYTRNEYYTLYLSLIARLIKNMALACVRAIGINI